MRLKIWIVRPEMTLRSSSLHKLRNLVPEGTLAWTGSWQHRTKSGSQIDVEMKWTPLVWKGRPASLTMANDVSERRRAEHRSAALSKLGQSLSSATSAQEAAGIIKDVADDLFRWDVFTLNLCSQDQEQLLPVLNVDTDEKGARFAISNPGRAIPLTPLAKRVIEHGAQMILRDEPFAFTDGATPIGNVNRPSGSLIFVPIRHGRRVIGILSIQSYTARAYDHRDLDMLQTLADHCGGAWNAFGLNKPCIKAS
jgi:transcriptional regulator with GAF, ATPase, and Fis domain